MSALLEFARLALCTHELTRIIPKFQYDFAALKR